MKEVKYRLDKNSEIPLYIQLSDSFRRDIISGNISDGEKLPARRIVAESLGISKNTVDLAMQKLASDGYADARPRSGYYARIASPVNIDLTEPDYYYNPGIKYVMSQNGVDKDSVPSDTLRKLYRDLSYDKPELFGFGHKYGEKSLRKAISHFMYELHGVSCNPNCVIVGAGSEFLLEQLCHIFDDKVFGFENPCFARSYIAVRNAGKKIELIDISGKRFPISALRESNIDVMYLSPDMQFPTGARMSLEEHNEIIEWVNEKDGRYIIEADFDIDFSQSRGFAPMFIAEVPEKVIYLGTFYRSIAPGFRTAYFILPQNIKDEFHQRLPYYMCLVSRLDQEVIAEYIESQKYQKHTAHLRRLYKKKRRCLETCLNDPRLRIGGAEGSTYVTVTVNNGMTEQQLKTAVAAAGVKLITLSACLIRWSEVAEPNTFIVGFGELSENEIKTACAVLREAWLD